MKPMQKVFFLDYMIERPPEQDDETTTLGIYSSETLAQQALERFSSRPEFAAGEGRLMIGPCLVDFEYWDGGFGPPNPSL